MSKPNAEAFWQAHLRLLVGCLVVWFSVSFGCGILFADALNAFSVGKVPLGFWFAQQGAIYAFLIIIVFYTWRVGKLERQLLSARSNSSGDTSASDTSASDTKKEGKQ